MKDLNNSILLALLILVLLSLYTVYNKFSYLNKELEANVSGAALGNSVEVVGLLSREETENIISGAEVK